MSKLTKEQIKELESLNDMQDFDIDTSDIPEVLDWTNAKIGQFYKPMKKQVTIRLDADVIAWLQKDGKGYQTRANDILRSVMDSKLPMSEISEVLSHIR